MSVYPPGPVVPTKFWRKLDGGRVQCEVCPNRCALKDGRRGRCFVRMAEGGRVVLATYGRSSGFCVDPIEKKPLNQFLPGTAILSFGTAGCNLTCSFCQNWRISRSREMETLAEEASPETIARAAEALRCRSVAFTYNDPVVFLEYAVDVAKECRKRNIKTVAVTAGHVSEGAREEFFAHMDAANVDLKAFTEEFYRRLCGGDLQTVLDTLIYLKRRTSVWIELTTLLVPHENDSPEEIERLSQWVVRELGPDTPIHFTAFHPAWTLSEARPTLPATLAESRRIALRNGLRYVYTGNISDEEGGSTYCHECGRRLIGRDGLHLTEWNLDAKGRCGSCGTPCAGVFEDGPGTWGARCMPVSMEDYG